MQAAALRTALGSPTGPPHTLLACWLAKTDGAPFLCVNPSLINLTV